MPKRTRVIIVGGGFAGLTAARRLANRRHVEVTLIDRRNHHLFQPLLYQVAMAGLSPAEIAFPIRSIVRRARNIRVLMATVQHVNRDRKTIATDVGEFEFDHLILACGAEHSYFGHDNWEDHAPGLKTLEQATEIRRRVLMAFEKAEAQTDKEQMRQWLTFVVIGGGPTGVELAGALGEITRYTLARDFRKINPRSARVILIEAGERILTSFADDLGAHAMRDLEKLGVQVWTNGRVSEVNSNGVRVGEEWLQAKTVIWAAGVKPSALNRDLGVEVDNLGRVVVTSELCLPDSKSIFVIGDQAHVKDKEGNPIPGLAPAAMQQGQYVADQILRDLKDKVRQPFHYSDKGQMATIGRRRAVAEIGRFHITGFAAWWMWLLIHIYYLIGFKNRFFVIIQWGYSYLTYRRGARLITQPDWHSKK